MLIVLSHLRWGSQVKKGKGIKKGKKGKKFLKDVGHKNTGFKTVYHKEEWGKSSKVSFSIIISPDSVGHLMHNSGKTDTTMFISPSQNSGTT